jgi:hypothetical protein
MHQRLSIVQSKMSFLGERISDPVDMFILFFPILSARRRSANPRTMEEQA